MLAPGLHPRRTRAPPRRQLRQKSLGHGEYHGVAMVGLMACLCSHAKVRHTEEAGGRCTAKHPRHGQCFCLSFTSELENERTIRL
jgi:hypothetical protein